MEVPKLVGGFAKVILARTAEFGILRGRYLENDNGEVLTLNS